MKKSLYTAIAIGAAVLVAGHDDAEASSKTYKVKSGDNLSVIAKKFNTTVDALKKLNKLKSDMIYINQTLVVSGKAQATTTVSVKNSTSKTSNSTYTVKKGDSLYLIALQNKLTVNDLISTNKLKTTNLYIGQKLKLSNKATSSNTKSSTSNKLTTSSNKTTSSSTYSVKSGDSLSKIASKYKMTVAQLKSLNALKSDMIFVGQKLKIKGSATASKPTSNKTTTSSTAKKPTVSSSSSSSTYSVKSGDSLSKIASKYKMTVAQLKSINSLKSDMIFVGQLLKIKGSATASKPSSNTTTANKTPNTNTTTTTTTNKKPNTTPVSNAVATSNLLTIAKKHLGTPYVWGGSNPNGFDCSGFIYYTFNQAGKSTYRTNAAGYYNMSTKVSSPKTGDIIFFKNTYAKGITHLGIYMGNGQFIHAGGDRVQISSVNESYWNNHFAGYGRL